MVMPMLKHPIGRPEIERASVDSNLKDVMSCVCAAYEQAMIQ
jgi:hypothetical protein